MVNSTTGDLPADDPPGGSNAPITHPAEVEVVDETKFVDIRHFPRINDKYLPILLISEVENYTYFFFELSFLFEVKIYF